MIEIDIPAIDPIQHEPKIFVGLSARQCLCILPGAALAVGAYFLFNTFSSDLSFISAITCVVGAVLMGWCKPYNMKFEQYLQLLYFNTFVANPKRIYKTDNEEERKLTTTKELEAQSKKQQAAEAKKAKAPAKAPKKANSKLSKEAK